MVSDTFCIPDVLSSLAGRKVGGVLRTLPEVGEAHHHPATPAFPDREGAELRVALYAFVDQVAKSTWERWKEKNTGRGKKQQTKTK